MITLFIFYMHTIAAAALFTSYWQEEGFKGGLVAVGFLALIFSVGWPMCTIVLNLVFEPSGLGPWLDRDTMSLLLLTALETAGAIVYLSKRPA